MAEREKRLGSESINSSTDELNERTKNDPAHHLLEEIRQAVNEANAKGKFCVYFKCDGSCQKKLVIVQLRFK